MKKAIALIVALMMVFAFSGCTAIKDRIASEVKHAVEEAVSALPDKTQETTEETAAPEESAASEDTQAPEDTTAPEETAAPEQGQAGYWPDDIPGSVPKFSYGKFVKDQYAKFETDQGATYGMHFTDVTKANMDEYAKTLKAAKYELFTGEADGKYSIVATLKNGDKEVSVVTAVLTVADKTCDVGIIASKENK